MTAPFESTLTPTVDADPRRGLATTLSGAFGPERVTGYVSRALGALPSVVEARPGMPWRSALLGPTSYPTGYRDAVVLARGRLVPIVVRQRHRDGNVNDDAAAEIDRALKGAANGTRPGRLQRPLIPSMLVDGVWLVKAARAHDVPLGPGIVRSILPALRNIAGAAKSSFRMTLDPEVSNLLIDDESLEGFYDWLADHALADDVRRRRREAYALVGAGCALLTAEAAYAERLDQGASAVALLADLLDSTPEALTSLLLREPEAFRSIEEARRKVWAVEFLGPEKLMALDDDLDVAGGWAGRLMSFAAVATDDLAERRELVASMLEHGSLRRFEPHDRSFAEWRFDDGRLEFASMLGTVIKYGLLPGVMIEAEAANYPVPTLDEIAIGVRKLARIVPWKIGIMAIETARRRWRDIGTSLPKIVAAACHPSSSSWPALIERFETDRSHIDCLDTLDALGETFGRLKGRPALLFEALAEGRHVLRLCDKGGATAALTTVTQDELERAAERGHVGADDVKREGWAVNPQWNRWMRVEVARMIDAVAKGKAHCDLAALRRALSERAETMRAIEALPCGFDHRNAEARNLAALRLGSISRLLLRKPKDLAVQIFGGPLDPDLIALRAVFNGEPDSASEPNPRPAGVAPPPPEPPRTVVARAVKAPASLKPYQPGDFLNEHRIERESAMLPSDISDVRLVVADVETTGLSDDDRIVEIALVEMLGTSETGRVFHSFVNPGIPIPPAVTSIHGITDAAVRRSPRFAAIAREIADFVGGAWFVAHNAEFDVGFINRELEAAGVSVLIRPERSLCTMSMADAVIGTRELNQVCDRLGVDRSGRSKHGALIDARLCARAFAKLLSPARHLG
jgi:DNA polymerase-3 subunit epsilon